MIAWSTTGSAAAGAPGVLARPAHADPALGRPSSRRAPLRLVQAPPARSRLLLPTALVGCAAAAGVQAARGLAHVEVGPRPGLLLVGVAVAVAQLAWVAFALGRTSSRLLLVGVIDNLLVAALSAVTRTWVLPFGPLPGPGPGVWDLTALAWEVVSAAACLRLLQQGRADVRLARWSRWHPAARSWVVVSVVLLAILSTNGAGG